jgi:hypothetical protein
VRRLAGPLVLGLAGACNQAPVDLGPFTIQPLLDTRPGSGCDSATCEDYGMSCGAVVSIRILDTEDDDRIVGSSCQTVQPDDTLCGLSNLNRGTFFNIPPHHLRIELAAWREEVLVDDPVLAGDCPDDDIFDLRGAPLTTYAPQPAFAGADYYDASDGSDSTAEVRLACTDPGQLDEVECSMGSSTEVAVQVDDVQTALDISPEQAANLSVGAAVPRAVPDDGGGTHHVIEAGDTFMLTPQPGPVPRFTGSTSRELGTTVCAVVLDLAPQSTTAVTCSTVEAGADPLALRGTLVANETLEPILDAMGETSFPEDGLVVGRVFDHTGVPLGEVAITPEAGTVEYLAADLSSIGGSQTASSGFFIARDVPFGTAWSAMHTGDGRAQVGTPNAGLVRGKVTALIIRMKPP